MTGNLRTSSTRLQPLSLEQKLPLFLGALLLAAVTLVTLAAFHEMRRSAMHAATDRVSGIATQLAELFQQSVAQLRSLAAATARAPALADFAHARTPATEAAARAALHYIGPNPEQVLVSELRDARGAAVLSDAPAISRILPVPALPASGDSTAVGSFITSAAAPDTIVYPTVARIPATGDSLYLVRWRRLVGSRRTREQMSKLVGSSAAMFIGTPGRAEWTNLERIVTPPPAVLRSPGPLQRDERDPDRAGFLASVAPIPGSPWAVIVHIPVAQVMQPVHEFVLRVAAISATLLLLALLAARYPSRRLTAPLRRLTSAATAIAGGDYSQRADIARSDELGQLGTAFNSMAAQVEASHHHLEQRITDRTRELRDAQESLLRRERLALLGQLSSGVGHELRNPLGVMTNAVYYLRMVLEAQPAQVKEYLDILQQQITLSEKIVSDLLDFARSRPPQRARTALADVLQAQIARLAKTDDLDIQLHFADYLPEVLVDAVQLGQIIFNLITNASQAMHGRGQLDVSAVFDGSQVHLEVADSGPGIAPENIEKVFEPLFSTKARGIGLGLSVSRTLARANGGDLTVRSTPGEGATFRLTLQAAALVPAEVA